MIRVVWRWLRRSASVDGDRLLREARRERIGDQDVLLFDRMLTPDEIRALKAAWELSYIVQGIRL